MNDKAPERGIFQSNQKTLYLLRYKAVRMAGVEPARRLRQGILSPRCLPFHHIRKSAESITLSGKKRKDDFTPAAYMPGLRSVR